MKNKFVKNLFQSLSFGGCVIVLIIPLICGYYIGVKNASNQFYFNILLFLTIALVFIYFIVGFYWIFQVVEFSEKGINIKLLKKELKFIYWSDITSIEKTSKMRNPAIKIISKQFIICLDDRKSILNIINYYKKW